MVSPSIHLMIVFFLGNVVSIKGIYLDPIQIGSPFITIGLRRIIYFYLLGDRHGSCTFVALEKHECKSDWNDDWIKWNDDWEKAIPWLPECSHKMPTNGDCQATGPLHYRDDFNNVPWNIQNCVVRKDKNTRHSNKTNYNVFKCERGNL